MECIVHARVLTSCHDPADRCPRARRPTEKDPWPALFALCLGFFMILVDSTIVSVATPAIIEDLHADVNDVVWVTSAYLLAYAVPVLITGRLGDRFGPKRLYLAGLTVFTLASLWCGLTGIDRGADRGPGRAGPRRLDDHAADDGDHHPHLPGRPPRRGDGAVGRDRRRRHAGRPDPRRRAGRRASAGSGSSSSTSRSACVGVRPGLAAGADAETHTHQLRLAGRRAQRRRDVPAGLRHPGGPPVRTGHTPAIWATDRRRARGARRCSCSGRPATRASRWCRSGCSATATSRWPTSRSRRWASRSPRWRSRS